MYLFIVFVLLVLIGIVIHIRMRSMRAEKFGSGKKSSKKISKKPSKKLDKNKYTINEFMDLQAKNYAADMNIEY